MSDLQKSEVEYDAGYNAFMQRCGYYALAHAGQDGMWQKFWEVGQDDAPETTHYRRGWEDARDRMHREVNVGFGGQPTPRDPIYQHFVEEA